MYKMNKKVTGAAVVTLSALVLSACGSPQGSIQDHWSEAAGAEEDFPEMDEELTELAQEEQNVFENLTSYENDEQKKIESSVEEAVSSVNERKELMEKEREEINQAYGEAMEADEPIENLENEKMTEKAKQAQQAMEKRNEAFNGVHEAYMEAADKEIDMYESFNDEDLELEAIEEQLDTINSSYEEVESYRETFNTETKAFNEAKNAFGEMTEEEG
ncbi:Putative cell-wall binding lipoprotein [Marinococcus luteus]|uniref:Putative cell-wall binding lipoprotein n=1 Tax=Marinococcus luteus TaxID=1122204 RepID=A0A1H2Q467_9BACI|nr:YkyA family protein [Marinococcus luteus]SDW01608.1 Putative cell-wall binding lipoprotein [Marinococcus luteus]